MLLCQMGIYVSQTPIEEFLNQNCRMRLLRGSNSNVAIISKALIAALIVGALAVPDIAAKVVSDL